VLAKYVPFFYYVNVNRAIEQRKAKNLSDCQWLGLNVNNDALNVLGSGYNVIMINTPNDESNSSIEILTKVADLANEGLLFMWAETTKKLEFCREQIPKWGYKIIDDIVWVKTTPLQRIYRSTTPTQGHFTSSKEHCLVAYKGSGDIRTMPLNRQIDCDVIVSEMRPHGQKPDEIYSMIERLYPTSRKLELFGSKKTPGWITCSPNIDGFQITDREMQKRYETLKSKNKSS
jgi:mRNA (2'-O-methyladenosine-N6-)-methyltransferase